ncbi:helix-turn-helix domain-containing protein [Sphingobacterium siyangense]|uniref:helix-turn-helix domain-containing protein n=1 Tax=Sphingobacterium TaxID=28453 RepID=UPI002053EA38|nr:MULTISPECIES: helix-turn-helix domain-containing protein [Sphingobacterium]UQA74165.1 helix-turn-helix domain-containing protein [Sphingobacterium siyangense]
MDCILPNYNINFRDEFSLITGEELTQFMVLDSRAHTHNFYILSFLYEGLVSHLSDFENKQLSGPAILMLDVDQVHTHPDMSKCKIVSIAFSSHFIADQTNQFLQKVSLLFSRPFIQISFEKLQELDNIIKIISTEVNKEDPDEELIKALLNVLIIQCFRLSVNHPITDQNDQGIYNNFKVLLKQNYQKQHQVKFYAEQLHVTTRTLNQCVRKSTFKTPKQLIDEHLLLEAKRLLFWLKVPAKEVAWELGFETDSYFNRFFKKYTGETPKEFQRKQFH